MGRDHGGEEVKRISHYEVEPGYVNAEASRRRWPWVPSSLVGVPVDVVRRVVAGDLYALRNLGPLPPGVK